MTHAAGRLFDSFAALLGIAPPEITYEGQPAMRLEALARKCLSPEVPNLPFEAAELDDKLMINWAPSFALLADPKTFMGNEDAFAVGIHFAVVDAAVKMVEYGLTRSRSRTVALSGGVFMNGILNELLIPRLTDIGVEVLVHRVTPPNDGCISFGQAVIAGVF